jgi:hypothetical protein
MDHVIITQNSDRDIHEPKLSEFRSRAITNGVGVAGCSIDRKTAAPFRGRRQTNNIITSNSKLYNSQGVQHTLSRYLYRERHRLNIA